LIAPASRLEKYSFGVAGKSLYAVMLTPTIAWAKAQYIPSAVRETVASREFAL